MYRNNIIIYNYTYIYIVGCAWHAPTPTGPKAAIKPAAQPCEGEIKLDPGTALQRACDLNKK
jgi:hypothetical protein